MTLTDQLSQDFDTTIRQRGRAYQLQGRVELLSTNPTDVTASVRGSRGKRYHVQLEWPDGTDGTISAGCSCPHFADGYLCKHLWAVILEVDKQSKRTNADPSNRILDSGVEPSKPADTVFEADRTPPQSLSAPEVPTGWAALMDDVRSFNSVSAPPLRPRRQPPSGKGEITFVLNVAECLEANQLMVRASVIRTNKQAAQTELPLRMKNWDIPRMGDQDAAELLLMLQKNRAESDDVYRHYRGFHSEIYGSLPDHFLLSPVYYPAVLPRLAASGRFLWRLHPDVPIEDARPIRWDAGAPYEVILHTSDVPDEQGWRVAPQYRRNGETPIDSHTNVVLTLPDILLFTDGRMSPARLGDQWGWVALGHQASGGFLVPYADRQTFRESLCRIPNLPECAFPEELALPDEVGSPEPKLRLEFREHNPCLAAHISFQYAEGTDCKFEEPGECIVGPHGIIRRDVEQEQQRLATLPDLGFTPTRPYSQSDAPYELPRAQFMDAVEALLDQGWTVEADNGVLRRSRGHSSSVTTGMDWFDLEAEFDFEGNTAKLPDLLSALQQGRHFVRLDDGSHGLLPQDWLEKFEKLTGLGEVQDDGNVRFRTSQALLLDALLASQENVRFDRGFAKFRKRLEKFDGIKPRQEPRTFRGTLREYQREGLGWLLFLQEFGFGGCLADDMGLGKTIQTLALLERRRTRKLSDGEPRHPSLIIVPKSLVFNWIDEAGRFTPKLKVLDYTGRERAQARDKFQEYDFLVTTYGTLRKDIEILKDHEFDYVILDEATAIKNANSLSAKACRLLKSRYRLVMTGTPIENHLGELWSLFEFLNPGLLGRSRAFERFARSAPSDVEARQMLQKAIAP